MLTLKEESIITPFVICYHTCNSQYSSLCYCTCKVNKISFICSSGFCQLLSRLYKHVRAQQSELQHAAETHGSHESSQLSAQTTTEEEGAQELLWVPCNKMAGYFSAVVPVFLTSPFMFSVPSIQFSGSRWSGGSC